MISLINIGLPEPSPAPEVRAPSVAHFVLRGPQICGPDDRDQVTLFEATHDLGKVKIVQPDHDTAGLDRPVRGHYEHHGTFGLSFPSRGTFARLRLSTLINTSRTSKATAPTAATASTGKEARYLGQEHKSRVL
jgi:hypothetical protein